MDRRRDEGRPLFFLIFFPHRVGEGNQAMDFFFNPKTVAVVGASATPGKISNVIIRSLKDSGFAGTVYPVNPKHDSVEGLRCYPSLAEVDSEIDVCVFAVPAQLVPGIIEGSGGKVRGAIIISGGFKETGEEGRGLEGELHELVKKEGVRIIGPNCMGIYDTVSRLDTFFIPPDRMKRPGPGGLSIISQSGSFAVTAIDELAAEGIGVARVVSYGNMIDVNESDCLEFLSGDDSTRAVAIYMESVSDGRRFVEAASRCSKAKPVTAIKVGKTPEAAAAARSHTGAMAGHYEVYRAALRKAGVLELDGYEDFISACKVFGSAPATKGERGGRRVMIITDGGGMGVGIADRCSALGLEVPPLSDEVKEDIRWAFPPYCSMANPMDLTGSATDELFGRALESTMTGDYYDIAIVAALWGPPALTDDLAGVLAQRARIIDKPVLLCSPGGEFTRSKFALFRASGLPVFPSPDEAARAAALIWRRRELS